MRMHIEQMKMQISRIGRFAPVLDISKINPLSSVLKYSALIEGASLNLYYICPGMENCFTHR